MLIIPSVVWVRLQSVNQNSWVSRLIKGRYSDWLVDVFLDDTQRVFMRTEGCHEEEGDVDTPCFVEVFDLLYGEIEKGHSVLHFKGTLRARHAYPIVGYSHPLCKCV